MKTITYILTTSLLVLFFSSFLVADQTVDEKYKQGYYISGTEKVEGYIYYGYDDFAKFYFKKELNGKKTKMSVGSCQGFFVDGKKFIILNEVDLKIGVWNMHESKVFAEVIMEGPLNLYKVYSMVGNGNMSAPGGIDIFNFIVQKKDSRINVLAHPNKSKFKKALSELVNEREDIVEKIMDETYNLSTIEDLVKEYNSSKL